MQPNLLVLYGDSGVMITTLFLKGSFRKLL